MATYSSTYDSSALASSASFQGVVQKIEAALLASGALSVAADTGQIDPTSVTIPAANAYAGFRMYKFTDATKGQMYMKVEYGLNASSLRAIRVTYGTATNGAGTITANSSTAAIITSSTAGGAAEFIAGGGGAYGGLCVMRSGASACSTFGMTRLLDKDGAVSAAAAVGFYSTAGASLQIQRTDYVSMQNAPASNMFPDIGSTGHTAGTPSKVALARGFLHILGESLEIPCLAFRAAEAGLVNALSAFSATYFGAPHTFLPITTASAGGSYVTSGGSGACMLFE